jgi:hypothetical protein
MKQPLCDVDKKVDRGRNFEHVFSKKYSTIPQTDL